VLDAIAFLKGAESVSLNGAEMDENVLARVILDEAESLALVEPLDRAVPAMAVAGKIGRRAARSDGAARARAAMAGAVRRAPATRSALRFSRQALQRVGALVKPFAR